ncbi:MAG: class I SAM-dependent methyltransferase [Proteobacteria bacterium]|nr:class I SAM-dependent methyltransferase [Pseudomonadota bacterium]
MTSSARFWDRIAARYARQPVPDEAVYQRKLQITRENLRLDMDVLEFGCGTGTTAVSHAPFVRRIHGIDCSSKMIDIARSRANAAGVENATFDVATIEDYSADNGSFDAVLGLNVLHVVDDWKGAIRKVHRLLKPGGVFVSSTSCVGGWMQLFRPVFVVGSYFDLIPNVQFIKARDLEEEMKNAGFVIQHHREPDDGRTSFVVAKKTITRLRRFREGAFRLPFFQLHLQRAFWPVVIRSSRQRNR